MIRVMDHSAELKLAIRESRVRDTSSYAPVISIKEMEAYDVASDAYAAAAQGDLQQAQAHLDSIDPYVLGEEEMLDIQTNILRSYIEGNGIEAQEDAQPSGLELTIDHAA